MQLKKLGEFGLINKIRKQIAPLSSLFPWVNAGIGDDAAVLDFRADDPDKLLTLLTTDTLVEGVHFRLEWTTPHSLGWKVLAVNLSDVAAMGGTPRGAVLTLGLRPDLPDKFITSFIKGFSEASRIYKTPLVGGDVVKSSKLFFTVGLLGAAQPQHLALRTGAKAHDFVFVTGTLGDSACGLLALKRRGRYLLRQKSSATNVARSHLYPEPRVQEAQHILQTLKVHSMIDISDGFASDLLKMIKPCGLGVKIYASSLPVSASCKRASKKLRKNPVRLALYGGEDYELAFTVPRKEALSVLGEPRLWGEVLPRQRLPITHVGEVLPHKSYQLVLPDGKVTALSEKGYVHF